ncbi:MAG TPA: hypothetical protein VK941_12140, partial [Gillisia sp.]|nr:hypothetical protein [Gillisia sp.]
DDIFKFFTRPGIAPGADFTVVEIGESAVVSNSTTAQRLFSQIRKKVVNLMPAEGDDIFSEINQKKIQRNFNMIIMLGKNLGICDRFLHTKHGIYSQVTNSLPILVLHGTDR